jgi:hypothetical protein
MLREYQTGLDGPLITRYDTTYGVIGYMKRLIRLAAKLYPRNWRDRYGEEFAALLDDIHPAGRVAFDVLTGATLMQIRRFRRAATGVSVALPLVLILSWWAGRRPFITPGTHQVFRMDSTPGALLEFLVLLVLAATGVTVLARAGRGALLFAGIAAGYLASIMVVSMLTRQTIVSIGDSYCWDLWCVGIQSVSAVPQGENLLYTAEVSLFADSPDAQLVASGAAKQFFYVLDERGRRFPVFPGAPSGAAFTVKPGETLRSSLVFLVPADARALYLTGDVPAPPWVRLYFGSDLNPLHRRTLLRVA